MNKDLKERIQAFSDLGILLRENSSKQKIKTFQKWDSELNKVDLPTFGNPTIPAFILDA